MLVLLILALALSISPSDALLKNTSAYSRIYQQKCLQLLPTDPATLPSMQALLCGQEITDQQLKESLSKSSLIHIFVVSGSHLILLDQVLGVFKIPFFLRFCGLGAYALVVGWQAPAVRALAALLLRAGFRRTRLAFPGDLIVLACGLVMLVLFPPWWQSRSFQMSWCAALALTVPSLLGISSRSWRGALLSQVFIFGMMAPLLWGWGSLHPVGILCNLILAPLVSVVLLPLSFFSLFHPWIHEAYAQVLSLFEDLLKFIGEPVQIPSEVGGSAAVFWVWIFGMQIFLHFLRLRRRQGKDMK